MTKQLTDLSKTFSYTLAATLLFSLVSASILISGHVVEITEVEEVSFEEIEVTFTRRDAETADRDFVRSRLRPHIASTRSRREQRTRPGVGSSEHSNRNGFGFPIQA